MPAKAHCCPEKVAHDAWKVLRHLAKRVRTLSVDSNSEVPQRVQHKPSSRRIEWPAAQSV
jgi:hypothetical protein